MKLLNQLRTKYNHLLESTIRLCMLTAVTFTVTACYAPAMPDDLNDPEWRKDQDTLEHRMEQMGKDLQNAQKKGETPPTPSEGGKTSPTPPKEGRPPQPLQRRGSINRE